MSKINKLYIFLDTSIFLQYKKYDQIAWPKLLNAKKVCLVIAPMVRNELEKHKTDAKSSRRQKRARDISPELSKLVLSVGDGEEVDIPKRPHVSILELSQSPDLSRYPGLQTYIQDDHIVASILDFQAAHPERTVVLVAGDIHLIIKARNRGIRFESLDDEYELSPEPNPDHKRILELEKEVARLKQAHPNLEISLVDSDKGVYVPSPTLEEIKKRERNKILEIIEDLEVYLRQKERRGGFNSELSEIMRPLPFTEPIRIDDALLVELKRGLQKLRISGFDEAILNPSDVYIREDISISRAILGRRTQEINGIDADWYRTVLKLRSEIKQAERNIHNVKRNQQFKQLKIRVENIGSVTADELEVSITKSRDKHALASSLDTWYLFDPMALYPYRYSNPLEVKPAKEWRKHELRYEQKIELHRLLLEKLRRKGDVKAAYDQTSPLPA